jgi:hypothetical protein
MDNYPAGVTGTEFAIAGADREYTEERTVSCETVGCDAYGLQTDEEVSLSSYGSQEWGTWTCTACGEESDYESTVEEDEGGDPDYLYETRRDEF